MVAKRQPREERRPDLAAMLEGSDADNANRPCPLDPTINRRRLFYLDYVTLRAAAWVNARTVVRLLCARNDSPRTDSGAWVYKCEYQAFPGREAEAQIDFASGLPRCD
jgi:hypothetical protein